MRVHRIQLDAANDVSFELLDRDDQPIPVVSGFMRHLRARGYFYRKWWIIPRLG
jgi:hypothetical protein